MVATLRKSLKTIEDYKAAESSLYRSFGYIGGYFNFAGRIPQKYERFHF